LCEALQRRGVLATDTYGSTVRLAPPLVISQPELEQVLDAVAAALADLARRPARRLPARR
jgi:ornithine--oxo-acid transaminase